MLQFYNTLTKKKQAFAPLDKKIVKIYTCGPTVYDYAHIGNLRSYLFADLLKRYLKFKGFAVKHVINITDVDDKTIKGAQKAGISLKEFTSKFKQAFFEDLKTLRIQPADEYPSATSSINQIVELITILLEKNYAYISDDNSIYFNIKKFRKYGRLSGLNLKHLRCCARIKQDNYAKKNASDFALWKAWSHEDGKVFWMPDIAGMKIKGRPGWHIECSAMSTSLLGNEFDIHTGGVDLIFPHHENEIAQSMAATGKMPARFWLHNEHLIVNGKKMSKSLGNYYTLRDLLKKDADPLALRYLLISSHYRSQINFTFNALISAKKAVDKLNNFNDKIIELCKKPEESKNNDLESVLEIVKNNFINHMDNDLNTPEALAEVFELIKIVNQNIETKTKIGKSTAKKIYDFIQDINKIFDIIRPPDKITAQQKKLIEKREQLRAEKKFREADEIRAMLRKKHIILEDTPEGVRWRKI